MKSPLQILQQYFGYDNCSQINLDKYQNLVYLILEIKL